MEYERTDCKPSNKKNYIEFILSHLFTIRINKSPGKIIQKLGLHADQLIELRHLITRRIRFIEEEQISPQNWKQADELTKTIDSDDVAFVALALELNCPLWTGDRQLSKSLSLVKTYQTSKLLELLGN